MRALRARIEATYLVLLLSLIAITAEAAKKNAYNAGFDHRAHAVPGGPYSVLDAFDVGFAIVRLSGSNSHTHFFNPITGEVGRITRYEWRTNDKVICTQRKCAVRYARGSHRVKLTVWDSTGDVASASTSVHVLAPTRPGTLLQYYPNFELYRGRKSSSVTTRRPSYSQVRKQVDLYVTTDFPKHLRAKKFSLRVHTSLEFKVSGIYQLSLQCEGSDCTLLLGGRAVAGKRYMSKKKNAKSLPMFAKKGRKPLEIIFIRRSPSWKAPRLVFRWRTPRQSNWKIVPKSVLTRNPSAYPPVLHDARPPQAAVGSIITLRGSSFIEVIRVQIGSNTCVAVEVASEFRLKCVVPGGSGRVKIRIVTALGKKSNAVDFAIVRPGERNQSKRSSMSPLLSDKTQDGSGVVGYYKPIKFEKFLMRWPNGHLFKAKQMTSIAMGPDNRYYIGSLNGFVHVVSVRSDYRVKDQCKSKNIGYTRSILGVAFNPADFPKIKLYATASMLEWKKKRRLPFDKGWKNGQVIMMQPIEHKNYCMVKTKNVITGLPVSNHDHGVNSIVFDSYGGLLISSGGSTNAGVSSPNDFLGGIPDSPLSGAILLAPVQKRNFNGDITYTYPNKPAKSVVRSGNVKVYASGVRNSFGICVHSNGKIYATDNGSNRRYGARSLKCGTGPGNQEPSSHEPDSLKFIFKGAFLGYANRNRGRWDKRQCRHWSPDMSRKKHYGYTKPLATLDASTNGLIEYTANTFGAQMRGDLLATKFSIASEGYTYRIQLDKSGKVKSKSALMEFSGLTAALTADGGLLMPRVYQSTIAVLRPREQNPRITVVTSVMPTRGPRRGGFKVTITGWHLYPPLTVRFGTKICTNAKEFDKNGRRFTCTAPSGVGKVPVVVSRTKGRKSRSAGWEFWYMAV